MAAQTMTATASTHRCAMVRGTHQLRIRGYGKRKAIKSRGFEAGGHLWAVSCAFDDDHQLASVSLQLVRTDAAVDVVAMTTLRIEHPSGGDGRVAEWRSDEAHVFAASPTPSTASMATCRTWELELPDKYRSSESKEDYVDDHGCFHVYCAVDVLQEDSDRRPDQIAVVPPPTISSDIGRLLLYHQEPETELDLWRRQCMLPDVTFVVEQAEIQAHRLVLAMRSPVFAAEFQWHTTAQSTLHVHDMSASTFRAMLHFIYTDELPHLLMMKKSVGGSRVAMALDLLVAADRYDIQSLRLTCLNILYVSMDAASVMQTLMVVRGRESCRPLEAFCIQYMASDPHVYAAVKATEDYKELKESCCHFILEVTDKVVNISMANTPVPDAPISSRSRQPQKMNASMDYLSSEVVEGTHEFKIPHFVAVQRRHGVGKEISSDTFQVGGYDWKLKVYPSSSSEMAEGHVSVYVELLSDPGTVGVKATVCFRMNDRNGWPETKCLEKTFTTESDWGYAKFITLESVKSEHVAEDGSITIRCHVSVIEKVCTSSGTTTDGARTMRPPSNIISHLEQLLVSEQGSDLRFLVEDNELGAHSLLIAARSPILYEAVVEANKDNRIILVNDATVAVFKAMLHFIYTDELPRTEDLAPGVDEDEVTIAKDLLVAACSFRLDRMKAMCENLLAKYVSEKNALSTLELAKDLVCSNLEDYCKKFIKLTELLRKGCIDYRLLNFHTSMY